MRVLLVAALVLQVAVTTHGSPTALLLQPRTGSNDTRDALLTYVNKTRTGSDLAISQQMKFQLQNSTASDQLLKDLNATNGQDLLRDKRHLCLKCKLGGLLGGGGGYGGGGYGGGGYGGGGGGYGGGGYGRRRGGRRRKPTKIIIIKEVPVQGGGCGGRCQSYPPPRPPPPPPPPPPPRPCQSGCQPVYYPQPCGGGGCSGGGGGGSGSYSYSSSQSSSSSGAWSKK